ncbi:MAG: MATE family efflux transporter [Firmicutes bacterium]|nr:MATE family efflux transporter [Bacillota bacterium]
MSEALEVKDKSKKYEIDMTEGSILKKMLRFAIPVMFTGLLQLLFNAADIVVVGRFAGDAALAAVGASSSPVHLVVTLLMGLSMGVNVTVARAFGAGRPKDIQEAVHTSITLALIGGVLMAIVGLSVCSTLLRIMGTPDEILPLSKKYMDILFMGIPIMALYNFGSGIFRARGDTRRPLYFLAVAGVINVCLNLFFVIVLHLDVVGVALATVLSQIVSMSLIMGTLMREKGPFRLELKKLGLYKSKVKPILVIGVPSGIQGMLFSISNMVIQSSINSFGKIVMAGSSASASIEGFTFVAMDSCTQSAMTFTSQNMGAGKIERIPHVFRTAVAMVTVAGLTIGNLTYLFGRPILGIYTQNPAVVDQGMIRLMIMCVPYFICGIMNVIPGVIRGMGYSIVTTIVTIIGVCGLRIAWIGTICQLPQCSTIEWVYASYVATWLITAIAHYIYYKLIYKKTAKRFNRETASAII